jgi:hypothetical protein
MEYDIDFFGSEQYFMTHSSVVWDVKIVFFLECINFSTRLVFCNVFKQKNLKLSLEVLLFVVYQ